MGAGDSVRRGVFARSCESMTFALYGNVSLFTRWTAAMPCRSRTMFWIGNSNLWPRQYLRCQTVVQIVTVKGGVARRELLRPPILCAACAGYPYFYQALASAGQEKIGIRNLDCVYLLI